uniref:Uncharacterized protein n=1 Tax=Anopheles atroparvus TaxID=41427 RepID=A0AAG5DWQ6_ANOAO
MLSGVLRAHTHTYTQRPRNGAEACARGASGMAHRFPGPGHTEGEPPEETEAGSAGPPAPPVPGARAQPACSVFGLCYLICPFLFFCAGETCRIAGDSQVQTTIEVGGSGPGDRGHGRPEASGIFTHPGRGESAITCPGCCCCSEITDPIHYQLDCSLFHCLTRTSMAPFPPNLPPSQHPSSPTVGTRIRDGGQQTSSSLAPPRSGGHTTAGRSPASFLSNHATHTAPKRHTSDVPAIVGGRGDTQPDETEDLSVVSSSSSSSSISSSISRATGKIPARGFASVPTVLSVHGHRGWNFDHHHRACVCACV